MTKAILLLYPTENVLTFVFPTDFSWFLVDTCMPIFATKRCWMFYHKKLYDPGNTI